MRNDLEIVNFEAVFFQLFSLTEETSKSPFFCKHEKRFILYLKNINNFAFEIVYTFNTRSTHSCDGCHFNIFD